MTHNLFQAIADAVQMFSTGNYLGAYSATLGQEDSSLVSLIFTVREALMR